MYSNILFDLDGTLTDSKEGIIKSLQFTLEQLGIPFSNETEFTSFIGVPLHMIFQTLLNSQDDNIIYIAIELYRSRFSSKGLFENRLYSGILDLLNTLRKNSFNLFVVTVKPTLYATKIIQHFALGRYFDGILGSSLARDEDDKSMLVESIIKEFKLNTKDTVMVGDRKEDITSGKLNHLTTIGVTYGYGVENEIINVSPDFICNNPCEIKQVLLQYR